MKIEELNQLEKELTWIFAHVPWSHPDAKRKAAQRKLGAWPCVFCLRGEFASGNDPQETVLQ